MTDDRVLISTHDLPVAGQLREGFKASGYSTDLVTPDEDLSADDSAVLLVLTGGAEEAGGSLASQARTELHIPVFAIAAHSSLAPALRPGFDEVFPKGAPVDDIVLLGSRLVERGRLQRLIGILGETDAMMEVLERVVQTLNRAVSDGDEAAFVEMMERGRIYFGT